MSLSVALPPLTGYESIRTRLVKQIAFTLTELLTVIAIIAIISVILASSVARFNRSSKNIKCLSNLKQMGIAVEAFAVQSDEYPLDFNPRQKNPNHAIDWQQSLTQSGAKGESLWTCPSARLPDDWPKNDTYLYYGYNSYGLGDNSHSRGAGGKFINQETGYQPVKRTTVLTPSDFILIGDGFTGNSEVILDGKNLIWRNPDAKETGNSTTRSQARHTMQGNILFGDSHVEAIPLKQLFSDPPHQAHVVWNVDGRD